MAKSFFGGDPAVAHYTVSVRFRIGQDEGYREQKERRASQEARLAELGFGKQRYFQFHVKDEAAKEKAKAEAEAYAAVWAAKAGFEVVVSEGCFL